MSAAPGASLAVAGDPLEEATPSVIEIVLTASNNLGTAAALQNDTGSEGFEMRVSFKERKVRLPYHVFERAFPTLVRRWRSKIAWKDAQYNKVTGQVSKVPLLKDESSENSDIKHLRLATIKLTMPSALFADCFAEALTMPTFYSIRPATQFSWYTIACMLNKEQKLIQCERFIANSLCTGTVVFALQHASRFGRNHLLHLCYQWLRRTGGVTPGYLLLHPERQLRVDVSAGLLYQWDPTQKEYTYFDLQQLAEIVASERSRKRKYYIPIKTATYDALKHSALAMKLAVEGAAAAAKKTAPALPEDGPVKITPAPLDEPTETTATTTGASSSLFSDIDLGLAAESSSSSNSDSDKLTSPTATSNASTSSSKWEDVSLLSPAKGTASATEAAAPLLKPAVISGFVSNEDVTAVSHPGVAFPFRNNACIAVEVGTVRDPEFVACVDGDRGIINAAAAPAPAPASAPSSTSSSGTTTPASAPPPTADAQRLFSGPGAGWPELMRCYVVRRRDGRGPGRVCRSATLEWQGVVASRLGVDADDENVTDSQQLAVRNKESSATPGSVSCCQARGGNHAVLRRTCFDDGEISHASSTTAVTDPATPAFISQPVPCPYHDGARPYGKKEDIPQWELGPRLFSAYAARAHGYYHRHGGSYHYHNYSDPFSEEFSEHAYAHAHEDESDLSDDSEDDDDNNNNRGPRRRSAAGSIVSTKEQLIRKKQLALQALFRGGAKGGWLGAVLSSSASDDKNADSSSQRSLFPRRIGEDPMAFGRFPTLSQLRWLRRRCTCTSNLYSSPPSHIGAALSNALGDTMAVAPLPLPQEQLQIEEGPMNGSKGTKSGSPADGLAVTGAVTAPGTFASAASQYSGTSAVKSASVVPGNSDALGPSGTRHVFELRRELDDSLIAVAVCTGTGGKFNFFTAAHPLLATSAHNNSGGIAPSDPYSYLGTTSCNLMGTCITLYDWGMPYDTHAADPNMPPGERPIPTLPMMLPPGTDVGAGPAGPLLGHPCGFLPSLGQRELARIIYDSNILASAPNRMTVELRHHDDYDALDILRAKALGRQVTAAASPSGGNGSSLATNGPSASALSSLSHAALYGLPPEATTQPGETSLMTLRAASSSSNKDNNGDGSNSSSSSSGGGGGILSEIPNFLPRLSAGGLLSKPQELDLRVCTPSTGFGIGLGASSGVGSWTGLLSSAWSSVVGAVSGGTSAATEAAAGTAGLQGLTAAATMASAKGPGITSSDKAAAAAAVTSAAILATGADAVKPCAVLMTRKPRWSDRLDAWTMDFRGRVVKASKKNFQLVAVPLAHRDDNEIYVTDHSSAPTLMFGKVAKDRYSLDFAPGSLGPVQAFCIALSTFASKLAVA
jgi:Tub family